jgi:hypothetical protein
MDKVQKHNSFNTNIPSSESYRNEKLVNSYSRHHVARVYELQRELARSADSFRYEAQVSQFL